MGSLSLEIKARCSEPGRIRKILKCHRASFKGLDRQIDTYFCVPSGRLKLREGIIENALIYYRRVNQKGSKRCDAVLMECRDAKAMKMILKETCGVLASVDKKREIYFIKNAKFHIDRVKKLGDFAEIEVFGPVQAAAKLKKQCEFYQKIFGIRPKDLVRDSYSDKILKAGKRPTGNGQR